MGLIGGTCGGFFCMCMCSPPPGEGLGMGESSMRNNQQLAKLMRSVHYRTLTLFTVWSIIGLQAVAKDACSAAKTME